MKCEGQFFNSEMTVLHSAFPSHVPSPPPFDAEWEAEFDKKLELFLDVALPQLKLIPAPPRLLAAVNPDRHSPTQLPAWP